MSVYLSHRDEDKTIGAQHLEPPVLITLPKNQVLHEILWDWCHLRELIEIYPFLQRSKKCPRRPPPRPGLGKYLLTVINPSATVQHGTHTRCTLRSSAARSAMVRFLKCAVNTACCGHTAHDRTHSVRQLQLYGTDSYRQAHADRTAKLRPHEKHGFKNGLSESRPEREAGDGNS